MTKRLNLDISDNLHAYLSDLAARRSTTIADLVRKGLAVVKAGETQAGIGRHHLGFVSDPSRLDVEILGIMDDDLPVRPPVADPYRHLTPATMPPEPSELGDHPDQRARAHAVTLQGTADSMRLEETTDPERRDRRAARIYAASHFLRNASAALKPANSPSRRDPHQVEACPPLVDREEIPS